MTGCLHHGHSTHTNPRTFHPLLNQTMAQLYNRTIEREKHLAQSGLTVRTIWECEYDKILKEDSDFRQAIADIEIIPPLNPRHALYG